MKIDLIVGARPNFMKAAPVAEQLRKRMADWTVRLIHTGQHYDENLSDIFFRQLGMPEPDVNLGIGSGSLTHQTAGIMVALEQHFRANMPDLVMVFGDVNSTLAAAVVSAQLRIPLAHVEAGLRSFDRDMPEEINRIVTDSLASLLFVTERSGERHLRAEGVAPERIHFVGNTMIDTLLKHREAARTLDAPAAFNLTPRQYVVVTLHRPSNVDVAPQLRSIVAALQDLGADTDVVFPVHPRTTERLKDCGLWRELEQHPRIRATAPIGYLEFLGLMDRAGAILTDSGGIQEEAVVLGVPCVTLRKNTERPVTLEGGANRLAGEDPAVAIRYVREAMKDQGRRAPVPEGWDGRAASRIVAVLEREFAAQSETLDRRFEAIDRLGEVDR